MYHYWNGSRKIRWMDGVTSERFIIELKKRSDQRLELALREHQNKKTHKEIALILGVSSNRVSQLIKKAKYNRAMG